MISIRMAGKPTAITSWKVNLKPYNMIPNRRICFEQNRIPGTQVSGKRFRRLLAYSIPKMIPTIKGLKDRLFTKDKSLM